MKITPSIRLQEYSFMAGKAGSFSGVPLRTVQSWTEKGLVIPDIAESTGTGSKRLYSVFNCIEIGIIKSLTNSRLSLKLINEIMETLRTEISIDSMIEHIKTNLLDSLKDKVKHLLGSPLNYEEMFKSIYGFVHLPGKSAVNPLSLSLLQKKAILAIFINDSGESKFSVGTGSDDKLMFFHAFFLEGKRLERARLAHSQLNRSAKLAGLIPDKIKEVDFSDKVVEYDEEDFDLIDEMSSYDKTIVINVEQITNRIIRAMGILPG